MLAHSLKKHEGMKLKKGEKDFYRMETKTIRCLGMCTRLFPFTLVDEFYYAVLLFCWFSEENCATFEGKKKPL